ncbi:ABC transporter ATP-binding protein [bacterium]|nr:ABC transporter ATP-binding protein [bacterium]
MSTTKDLQNPNMLTANKITKRYGSTLALNEFSLDVKKGIIFGLLGPNAAGKTTFLRAVLGLIEIDKGEVKIIGKNIDAVRHRIGYLPENGIPYEYLTGRDFLHLVGGLRSLSRTDIEKRITKYSELLQLYELDNLTLTYSKGTRQKLLLLATLLGETEILFLDEPLIGLDPIISRAVKDLIKNYPKGGKTVFLTTHILEIAEDLCDEVGIIKNGKLLFTGSLKVELKGRRLEELFLKLMHDA